MHWSGYKKLQLLMGAYYRVVILSVIFLFFVFIFLIVFFTSSPLAFPIGTTYEVKNGLGLNSLTENLFKEQIIRSPFLFKSFSVIFGGSNGVIAGEYLLADRENVLTIAKRFTSGDSKIDKIKILFPEGLNIFEIAKVVSLKFPKISEKAFISEARSLEGYLFPDTYFFEKNVDMKTIIKLMQDNFNHKILLVGDLIEKSGRSKSDIIKMASIIEEEAQDTESRKIVAGILWKRLSIGMPLQVDSSFKYINGKTTKDLNLDDLRIDSPYNSYLYRGLPPTPISNPGLDSIRATLNPTKTDFFYFLTDSFGKMHYAKSYDNHLLNKQKYLR